MGKHMGKVSKGMELIGSDMKVVTKEDLAKITGWFSKDCERIIKELKKHGMCIVNTGFAEMMKRCEDDGK